MAAETFARESLVAAAQVLRERGARSGAGEVPPYGIQRHLPGVQSILQVLSILICAEVHLGRR